MLNLYMKKYINTFFIDNFGFLDPIHIQKTVFLINMEKMFFSIQYLNIL